MEAKTCDVHVPRLLRYVQQLEDTHAAPDLVGGEFQGAVSKLLIWICG